ncbi:MAG: oxidoreductase [Betaproteobacteria bacterium]|nr:oxidoreductase [Betaproteobacteria bacterium]
MHQCLLGQIGFRADSRVYGVRVTQDSGAASRWAGAAAAAAADEGTLPPAAMASVGGTWESFGGVAGVRIGSPAGLLRLCLKPSACLPEPIGLCWGMGSGPDGWELRLESRRLVLSFRRGERHDELAVTERAAGVPAPRDVQVLDDGQEITIIVDGDAPFGRRFPAAGPASGSGVGLAGSPTALADVLSWEVFPRTLPMPPELDLEAPWSAAGDAVILADDLSGPPGDIAGRSTPIGGTTWCRLLGPGRLECDERGGARWVASAEAPLAGRTIYALDWNQPGFADLAVTLTPPGTARGQREHGTAGFCLWQDEANYLLINTWLDDCYGGASLSSFLKLDGFEDLYDAIWTNVGDRVTWGRPLRLRLVSDGRRYQVHIDGEPVLYRALDDIYPGQRPLRIARVGLLGNWEWGADTGSRFAGFEARGRRPDGP